MRAAVVLLALILLAFTTNGSLLMRQEVGTSLATTVPVTFGANGGITTVLGSNATSATVNDLLLLVSTTVDTLRIVDNATINWSMQLRVQAATGLTGSDVITLGLSNGSTQNVALTSVSSYPQTTAAVTLLAGGADANVTALSTTPIVGGCGALGACSFTLQVLFTPASPSADAPVLTYNYTLNVL